MNDQVPDNDELDRMWSEARTHYENEREPAAVVLFRLYLRYRPSDAVAWYWLGECLRILCRFDEALTAFTTSLDLADEAYKPIVLARLGLTHLNCGRHDVAESFLAQSCELSPYVGLVWEFRAESSWYRGDIPTALDYYRQALANVEENVSVIYCQIGNAHCALKRYADARRSYEQAFECNPENPNASRHLDSLQGIDDATAWVRRLDEPT